MISTGRSWRKWLLASSVCFGAAVACSSDHALAQIKPDSTLGAESSQVTSSQPGAVQIDGGATRGTNLFHSFEQFSVPTGGSAYFNNAANIQNIFSRVTGSSISHVDGVIAANGTANLFLINPNGIIFGPNSSLNIGGSFIATTANAIEFGDHGLFNASGQTVPSLLTVNPSAFLFNQINPGSITSQSATAGIGPFGAASFGLRVPDGHSLLFVGGDISVDGLGLSSDDANDPGLKAFGGRVELGGLSDVGKIGLNFNGNNLSLSFPDGATRADVSLTNAAELDVFPGEGSIAINARNLKLFWATLVAGSNRGLLDSQVPDVTINATGNIRIVSSSLFDYGGRGIKIQGHSIFLGTTQIFTNTGDTARGGDIQLVASDSVYLNNSILFSDNDTSSDSRLFPKDASIRSGDINIISKSFYLTNNSEIDAGLRAKLKRESRAGNVNINVSDAVLLNEDSIISSKLESEAIGKAGNININTKDLSLAGGSQIFTTTIGKGDAGNININTSDFVKVTGVDHLGRSSGLFSGTDSQALGQGGNIVVQTGTLDLSSGAVLSAGTFNSYRSGDITVKANTLNVTAGAQIFTTTYSSGSAGNITLDINDSVNVSGSDSTYANRIAKVDCFLGVCLALKDFTVTQGAESGLLANTFEQSTGFGGNLRIVTGRLQVLNGAQVSVSSQGSGGAGNLGVTAHSILLDNKASLSADTTSGQGNISLQTGDLILRHGSDITTNATGTATGGNITINTDNLVAVPKENSDISANATDSFGGRVIINAKGIFGTQFRPQDTPLSDITATSALGPQFNGTVQINTPGIDPSRGLSNLPTQPVDASSRIAQGCPAGVGPRASKFVVTGRGGLPPTPQETTRSESPLVDLGTLVPAQEHRASTEAPTNPIASEPTPLVEAQGWMINAKGEVVLTAQAPNGTPHNSWLNPVDCHAAKTSF